MATKNPGDIVVPPLGESVSEATIARWLKKKGDVVKLDEALVELETDKVTLEVNAPQAGILNEINVAVGATVRVGDLLGSIAISGTQISTEPSKVDSSPKPVIEEQKSPQKEGALSIADLLKNQQKISKAESSGPSAKKIAEENNLNLKDVPATGKDGRVTKGDVLGFLDQPPQEASAKQAPISVERIEERVKMTRLRQRIAERLKEAQNTAAMLTTFNEIDMSRVMDLRNTYKDSFEKKNGVRLGFMSFFVKAAVSALKEIPSVNAEISGDEIVFKNYYDIGVAVSAPQGLVVPVLRGADILNFAGIEQEVVNLSNKARDGKLAISDLSGATFTITNGGVFGSLMSTPILNYPQSGILGMHKIQKRPVVVDDKIEIRPMMYIALTYDHRIIDGREAVTFLVRIKECVENPERLLLNA